MLLASMVIRSAVRLEGVGSRKLLSGFSFHDEKKDKKQKTMLSSLVKADTVLQKQCPLIAIPVLVSVCELLE